MSWILRLWFGGSAEEVPVPPPAGSGTGTDASQCIKSSFDRGKLAIHCADQGAASGTNGTTMDPQQCWKTAFEDGAIKIVKVNWSDDPVITKIDSGQCIKRAFDPVKGAFRVVTGMPSISGGSKMDPGQIIKHIFDQGCNALRVETTTASDSIGTTLSSGLCIKKAFNSSSGMLKISEDA